MMQENSRNPFYHKAVIFIPAVFVLLLLSACGGGGDDSQAQVIDPDRLTVNEQDIKTNIDEGDTSHAQVSGSVYIQTSDADCERWITIDLGWLGSDRVCVSRSKPIVHVHWQNKTTGESGNVEAEYKGYSNPSRRYSWKASVRIASGTNEIEFSSWGEPVTVFINAGEDILSPRVVSTYPLDESDQVAWNASISVSFSESVDPSTVNSDSFIVSMVDGARVDGDISTSESALNAYFKSHGLYPNTQYYVTLTSDILDISGKPLYFAYSWTFSTGEGDYDPPIVTATTPQADEIDYSLFESISANFSEPIDHSSVNPDSMSVRDIDNNLVDGSIAITTSGGTDTITFEPTNPLQPLEVYTVTIDSSITDTAANPLIEHSWSFTTAPPDVTPPTVSNVIPGDGDICVPLDQTLSAIFDEKMDPSSFDTSSFLLTDIDGNPVSGAVSIENNTSEFKLTAPLSNGTQYMATITNTVADLSGNFLNEDFSWTFSTATPAGSWTELPTENAPPPTSHHTAVWTGNEMIVWGGWTDTGGRYNLTSDSWSPTSMVDAPSPRSGHTAVWTGSEMIVWGGTSGWPVYYNNGARYDPVTDSWQPVSMDGAPSGRTAHIAVWTGEEMIIWGGYVYNLIKNAAKYNPTTDTWTWISAGSTHHQNTEAAWTGTEMIVIPNQDYAGRIYDPETDLWREIARDPDRDGREVKSIAWTGNKLLVRGLDYFSAYDPDTDSWTALPKECSTNATNMVAAGNKVIAHGQNSASFYSGAVFDLSSNTWTTMPLLNTLTGSYGEKAVWTGNEMIVWDGDGGRFVP